MKTLIYSITAITNLHVGSGEANYGVVDNLIQRDAATTFPVINASSLKGALREHCENTNMKPEMLNYIFGSEAADTEKRNAGHFRFFDANLLAMPVRGDKLPYLMGTCPLLVEDYLAKCAMFTQSEPAPIRLLKQAKEGQPLLTDKSLNGALLEDCKNKAVMVEEQTDKKEIERLEKIVSSTGEEEVASAVSLFADADFKRLCNDSHLPVIARNCLVAGKENLWYEQVLPRFSKLYFFVLVPDNAPADAKLPIENGLVQIGANATVGYGYCKIRQINTTI